MTGRGAGGPDERAGAGADAAGSGYVRGAGGAQLAPGRLAAILAGIGVVALAALSAVFAVSTTHDNSRRANLRHHGVAVEVTVSGCLGISSGIGMGIEYWQCRGDFTLGGQTYNRVITGNRALLEEGSAVPAFAVPGRPPLLYSPAAVKAAATGRSYAVTWALAGAAALLAAGSVALNRAARRRTGSGAGPAG